MKFKIGDKIHHIKKRYHTGVVIDTLDKYGSCHIKWDRDDNWNDGISDWIYFDILEYEPQRIREEKLNTLGI